MGIDPWDNGGVPANSTPPAWGSGEGLKTPHRKKKALRNVTQGLVLVGSCEHDNGCSVSINAGNLLIR
jgi:hypothetical protein